MDYLPLHFCHAHTLHATLPPTASHAAPPTTTASPRYLCTAAAAAPPRHAHCAHSSRARFPRRLGLCAPRTLLHAHSLHCLPRAHFSRSSTLHYPLPRTLLLAGCAYLHAPLYTTRCLAGAPFAHCTDRHAPPPLKLAPHPLPQPSRTLHHCRHAAPRLHHHMQELARAHWPRRAPPHRLCLYLPLRLREKAGAHRALRHHPSSRHITSFTMAYHRAPPRTHRTAGGRTTAHQLRTARVLLLPSLIARENGCAAQTLTTGRQARLELLPDGISEGRTWDSRERGSGRTSTTGPPRAVCCKIAYARASFPHGA